MCAGRGSKPQGIKACGDSIEFFHQVFTHSSFESRKGNGNGNNNAPWNGPSQGGGRQPGAQGGGRRNGRGFEGDREP